MNATLIEFLYNTLRPRANDPSNTTFFLPGVLARIPGPGGSGTLLPLQEQSWNVGAIQGNAGTFIMATITQGWWQYLNGGAAAKQHQPIGCPSQPLPTVTLTGVTIGGLNSIVLPETITVTATPAGYTIEGTLPVGGIHVAKECGPLTFSGGYDLTFCCCSAPATADGQPLPTVCDGFATSGTMTGSGTFSATLTGIEATVKVCLSVTGSGGSRSPELTVQSVTLAAAPDKEGPQLSVGTLTLDTTSVGPIMKDLWTGVATAALTAPEALAGFLTAVNESLNDSGTLQAIGAMLTAQVAALLDSMLGDVPAAALPAGGGVSSGNPVDQYVFDRLRYAVNSPASPLFLPAGILGIASPSLDPLNVGTVAIGDVSTEGLSFSDVRLIGVTMTGLSNAVVDTANTSLTADGLQVTVQFGMLDPSVLPGGRQIPAPPVTVSGQFSVNLQNDPTAIGGGLSASLQTGNVAASIALSGTSLDDLTLGIEALTLEVPVGDITVAVDLQSVFAQTIGDLLSTTAVTSALVQEINSVASQNLSAIGEAATTNLRALVTSRIGS